MSLSENLQFGVSLINGANPFTIEGTPAGIIQCLLTHTEGVDRGRLIGYLSPERKISQNQLNAAVSEARSILLENDYSSDIFETRIDGKKRFVLVSRLAYTESLVIQPERIPVEPKQPKKLAFDKIISTVTGVTEIPEEDIIGSSRYEDVFTARMLTSYFAYERYLYELSVVARNLRRDHASISSQINVARKKIKEKDGDFYYFYTELTSIFDELDKKKL